MCKTPPILLLLLLLLLASGFHAREINRCNRFCPVLFLTVGEYLRNLPAVWCFKCAQWGRRSDITSQMDSPWPTRKRTTVAQLVVFNQTTSSTFSGGNITCSWTWNFKAWTNYSKPFLSDSAFRCSPSGEQGLLHVDLTGSGPTGTAQWPAHRRQAGHHAVLHLHPQDRRERRDPSRLLLLSGNQSVERFGKKSLGASYHVSRPTRMLFY